MNRYKIKKEKLDDYLKLHIDENSKDILYLFKTKEHARRGYQEYIQQLEKDIKDSKVKYECVSYNSRALFITINSATIYFKSINAYNNIIGLRVKEYHYR